MSPDQDNLRHIATALQTEPDDLALNRTGKLSTRQAHRLGVEADARVEQVEGEVELVTAGDEWKIVVGERELADVGPHRGAFEGLALRVYYVASVHAIVNAEPAGSAEPRARAARAPLELGPDELERSAMGELGKALLLFSVLPLLVGLAMSAMEVPEAVTPLFVSSGAFFVMGVLAFLRQLWVAWLCIGLFALMGLGVLVFFTVMASGGLSNLNASQGLKAIFAYGAAAFIVGVGIPFAIKLRVIDPVRRARAKRLMRQ